MRFCSADYHEPVGFLVPPEVLSSSSSASGPARALEISSEEWDLVTRALSILVNRGVIGLVAHDRTSSHIKVRLLPLPSSLPSGAKQSGSSLGGFAAAAGASLITPAALEEDEAVQELRRVLEQRRECSYGDGDEVQVQGGEVTPAVSEGGATTRLGASAEGVPRWEGGGVLCERCVGDGWISELSLPKLLDKYRAGHTDSTCNAPACSNVGSRCGCRGAARRRKPNAAKPLVFGWSRNSAYHGLAASAQACNMSREDAEVTYSEYAAMQLEGLH
ncbi:hypothetical protein cyc_08346 [Cyclospora cayetanensis]|nr:hypothetical protein cyc_08346 [Cyclospora cayetanensis]